MYGYPSCEKSECYKHIIIMSLLDLNNDIDTLYANISKSLPTNIH